MLFLSPGGHFALSRPRNRCFLSPGGHFAPSRPRNRCFLSFWGHFAPSRPRRYFLPMEIIAKFAYQLLQAMKGILKLAVFGIAAIAAFSSCSKNEVVPSQKDIETKIIGKWKRIKLDGVEHSTNMRQIATFENGGKMYSTTTMTATGKSIWEFQAPFDYECIGNTVRSRLYFDDGTLRSEMQYEVQEINETAFKVRMFRTFSDGAYKDINTLVEYRRINADYSQDIIGLWEGVGMTGGRNLWGCKPPHRIQGRRDIYLL